MVQKKEGREGKESFNTTGGRIALNVGEEGGKNRAGPFLSDVSGGKELVPVSLAGKGGRRENLSVQSGTEGGRSRFCLISQRPWPGKERKPVSFHPARKRRSESQSFPDQIMALNRPEKGLPLPEEGGKTRASRARKQKGEKISPAREMQGLARDHYKKSDAARALLF